MGWAREQRPKKQNLIKIKAESILSFTRYRLIMALKLHVPSIVCSGCGNTITEAIKTVEPEAKIDVDLAAKTVTVEAKASEESIKQAVVASGHTVLEA